MLSFSYYYIWVVIAMSLLTLIIAIYTYRQQKEYRNGRSLFAIGIIGVLTLSVLLLAIAQARGILLTRSNNGTLFSAIFLLVMATYQLAFPNKTQQSRGWRLFRVCFAVFAVILAIFIAVGYIYNW